MNQGMRLIGFLCLGVAAVLAQSSTSVYTYDVNGRRVEARSSDTTNGTRTERLQNLNGRTVPQEITEERVVSNEGGVRVTERIVRRFDQNGNEAPPEKVLVEERRGSGGMSTTLTTVFRGDGNGRFAVHERSTTESRAGGGITESETRIERPTLNGSFDLVERRLVQRRETQSQIEADQTTFRKDANGRMYEAAREETRETRQGDQVVTQTSEFEAATTGTLQLSRRSVSRLVKDAAGNENRVVDVYGVNSPGRPAEPGTLRLREQQIIERQKSADGSVVETFSIRRPGLADANTLGPAQKISETVCRGNCKN